MSRIDQLMSELRNKPGKWLVTGVAGFIGSNILEMLLELNQSVVGLDNFSTGYLHNLDDVQKTATPEQWNRFTFIEGDIRNLDDCRKACAGVDFVLHQAALGSVPRSIDDPIATNQSNVDGFVNMLVAAREERVKRFVFASSSAVYGDIEQSPKVEDSIGNSISPYATSKLINELYAGVFSRVYEFEWIGLRYFNVFGKRQDPKGAYAAVIPRWIDALMGLQTPIVNGDGETSRDFCYIKNVVQANILSALSQNRESVNKAYNIAFGERTTLNQLLDLIRQPLTKYFPEAGGIAPEYGPFRKGDVRHSLADISRAGSLLGYAPEYNVKTGMDETVRWYVESRRAQANPVAQK